MISNNSIASLIKPVLLLSGVNETHHEELMKQILELINAKKTNSQIKIQPVAQIARPQLKIEKDKVDLFGERLNSIRNNYRYTPIIINKNDKAPYRPFTGMTNLTMSQNIKKLEEQLSIMKFEKVDPTDFNIGVATGYNSNIVVVDFDWKSLTCPDAIPGMSVFPMFQTLLTIAGKKTFTMATPSGGRHLYFKYDRKKPLRTRIGTLIGSQYHAIDIRSNKGYVVFEGCVNGKKYEIIDNSPVADMPESIYQLLKNSPKFAIDEKLNYPFNPDKLQTATSNIVVQSRPTTKTIVVQSRPTTKTIGVQSQPAIVLKK